ncbi:hypothetical protein SAMN02745248_00593 [Hathewaya proteolytica DSM 3090]|uniref:Uncharacterized protein n=1 Tax=Hathewaya proteolytica DSM 3090 TaxID=1121331 RepID=A0A1M6L2C3_9CLOT|nr:hypothetical protein [Hathewaya proteolytica]SHJ65239.1 hypothetical protein SAMN02745248_00593 [Hathewaya proteolytica DSM 3090]
MKDVTCELKKPDIMISEHEIKINVLTSLLIDKGIITEDEFNDAIKLLLEQVGRNL